jgi:hypothetical protein
MHATTCHPFIIITEALAADVVVDEPSLPVVVHDIPVVVAAIVEAAEAIGEQVEEPQAGPSRPRISPPRRKRVYRKKVAGPDGVRVYKCETCGMYYPCIPIHAFCILLLI